MNQMPLPAVYSMYWNNISKRIHDGQKSVFDFLNIDLIQENADQISHGAWMEGVIKRHKSEDLIVFCDIDAFPLNYDAYLVAVKAAQNGRIYGLAQFSNHKVSQQILREANCTMLQNYCLCVLLKKAFH